MYTFNKTFSDTSFESAVTRTKAALSAKGFGVLTEIDVKQTMKTKLNADIAEYLIIGACNPAMAHKAIGLEPRVGAMLPCNVIVRSIGEQTVEVSAIDPVASMRAIPNAELHVVAAEVAGLLQAVVEAI